MKLSKSIEQYLIAGIIHGDQSDHVIVVNQDGSKMRLIVGDYIRTMHTVELPDTDKSGFTVAELIRLGYTVVEPRSCG